MVPLLAQMVSHWHQVKEILVQVVQVALVLNRMLLQERHSIKLWQMVHLQRRPWQLQLKLQDLMVQFLGVLAVQEILVPVVDQEVVPVVPVAQETLALVVDQETLALVVDQVGLVVQMNLEIQLVD